MPVILQSSLPVAPWMAEHTLRLPGTVPIAPGAWLQRDEVFAEQMAYRDDLIAGSEAAVHAMDEGCGPAAEELLGEVLRHLDGVPGYVRKGNFVRRPDGAEVALTGAPLIAAGRLVQEDLLVLQKPEGTEEHVLTGGILCFPSNWMLSEKFGKALARIHLPVEHYDEGIARRVQRLFDGLRVETPIMRANLVVYAMHDLYNPRHEFDRHRPEEEGERCIRVERQVLMRLPVTRAIVFSIHTYMVRPAALSEEQRRRLMEVRPDLLAEPASTR
jgi:dimethylamine monooxygenase subunit A